MDERQTRRSGKKQRNVAFIAVAAVVLLVIGGIIGSAIQSGKVKSAKAQLNEATAQLTQLGDKYEEQIATMQQLLEDKQAQIDQLQSGAGMVPTTGGETGEPNEAAPPTPESNDEEGGGLGILGTFIIIFIIILLVIAAVIIAYNAFRKKGDDDYDDDDDDEDEDEDDDYDEYEDDEEE